MPESAPPVRTNRTRPRIPCRRCRRPGHEGRRQRCRSRCARRRRVQRQRAHGRGGDAEGIRLARPGPARVSGQALGLDLHQRPDPRRHSPAGRRRDGAGQSHRRRPLHRPARSRANSARSRTTCTSITTMSTRSPGRSASSGRGARRRRRWRPTRASPTPTAAALTPPPGARCWPTRAALWAAIAPAMPAFPQRRWPWTRTARCSATAGGASARRLAHLESPEAVGAEAARRTLRRLGARRVPTQRVPIVFAPEVARSLIGSVFEAASGDSIWRHASFLAGKLGETDRRART